MVEIDLKDIELARKLIEEKKLKVLKRPYHAKIRDKLNLLEPVLITVHAIEEKFLASGETPVPLTKAKAKEIISALDSSLNTLRKNKISELKRITPEFNSITVRYGNEEILPSIKGKQHINFSNKFNIILEFPYHYKKKQMKDYFNQSFAVYFQWLKGEKKDSEHNLMVNGKPVTKIKISLGYDLKVEFSYTDAEEYLWRIEELATGKSAEKTTKFPELIIDSQTFSSSGEFKLRCTGFKTGKENKTAEAELKIIEKEQKTASFWLVVINSEDPTESRKAIVIGNTAEIKAIIPPEEETKKIKIQWTVTNIDTGEIELTKKTKKRLLKKTQKIKFSTPLDENRDRYKITAVAEFTEKEESKKAIAEIQVNFIYETLKDISEKLKKEGKTVGTFKTKKGKEFLVVLTGDKNIDKEISAALIEMDNNGTLKQLLSKKPNLEVMEFEIE